MSINPPKRGEVRPWMLWLMASAIVAMAGALALQDRIHRKETALKDEEIQLCQNERTKAETAFRMELKALYKEVQDFREEIYRQSMAQQRTLKRLKR